MTNTTNNPLANAAAAAFNGVVDAQYPAMQAQRAAMLSGVNLNLGIAPSGEQFTGSQAIAGIIPDSTSRTV